MKVQLSTLFLLLQVCVFGQSYSVQTDTTEIRIGEQFEYKIAVQALTKVDFPKLDSIKGVALIQEKPADTIANSIVKKYVLSSFKPGEYYIPSRQFFVNDIPKYTDSILIKVHGVSVDSTQVAQSRAAVSYEEAPYSVGEFIYDYKWLWWIPLAITAIVLLILYIIPKKKPAKAKPVKVIPPYVIAQSEIKTLQEKQLWQNDQLKAYYTELSEIVRRYLGRELKLSTLEITSDELLTLISDYNKKEALGLDKEDISQLKNLLSQADFVKFAKEKPLANEIEGNQAVAVHIIDKVHRLITQKNQSANENE